MCIEIERKHSTNTDVVSGTITGVCSATAVKKALALGLQPEQFNNEQFSIFNPHYQAVCYAHTKRKKQTQCQSIFFSSNVRESKIQ